MKTTISLGELVATAFDEANRASKDPREVTALATLTVEQLLRRANRAGPLQRARR
jgi:hypothetical protein